MFRHDYDGELLRLQHWYADVVYALQRGACESVDMLRGFSETYACLGIRPFVADCGQGAILYGFVPQGETKPKAVASFKLEKIVAEAERATQRAA